MLLRLLRLIKLFRLLRLIRPWRPRRPRVGWYAMNDLSVFSTCFKLEFCVMPPRSQMQESQRLWFVVHYGNLAAWIWRGSCLKSQESQLFRCKFFVSKDEHEQLWRYCSIVFNSDTSVWVPNIQMFNGQRVMFISIVDWIWLNLGCPAISHAGLASNQWIFKLATHWLNMVEAWFFTGRAG